MDITRLRVLPGVYPPREDSFLLANNIPSLRGKNVLDLGCGTGIQGVQAYNTGAATVTFSDISGQALANARKNLSEEEQDKSLFVQSDLFENIPDIFDCILFNPPYVPTEGIRWPDTDGGRKGREVLDRFLMQMPGHVSKAGLCLFIQSTLNGVQETQKALEAREITHEIIARTQLFFEELVVVQCAKR